MTAEMKHLLVQAAQQSLAAATDAERVAQAAVREASTVREAAEVMLQVVMSAVKESAK